MQKAFEKFYKKIRLTKKQRKDARTKYNGVCESLHDYYRSKLKYDGKDKLLIGSYAKKTNIRPPRDVDVMFLMPPEEFNRYDKYSSNGQSQLLQDVRDILKNKYTKTNNIKAWGKVVLVEFADGRHNIELLPVWKKENGLFTIPNSENGGSWEIWDPISEINYVEESNKATAGRTRRLIRIVKKWVDNCSVGLKSYLVETSVIEFLFGTNFNRDYSFLLLDFFKFLENKNDVRIQSTVTTARQRAQKACDLELDGDIESACGEWRKIFGNDFVVAPNKLLGDTISDLMKKYPSQKEEFLTTSYGIPISINPSFKMKIDADLEVKGWRTKLLSEWIKARFLIKLKSLNFKIVYNNVPKPYDVWWKVRNFGDEAMQKNGLRGEITKDKGREAKKEHTEYFGKHYVECYIVKSGICVAYDRIQVPIGNN